MDSWTKVRLDPVSSIPLFRQIVDWISDAISTGILQTGEKLPNELELSKIFEVSRITVRNALLKLQNEGYLSRGRGKGTFISSREITFQYVSEKMGLGEELVKKKISIEDKVLRCEVTTADPFIAEKLNIPQGAEIFALERLRIISNEPLIISKNYIPYEIVQGIETIDFSKHFLYSVLEKHYQILMAEFIRSFEPIILSEHEQNLFRLPEGLYPAFKIESITFDSNRRLIEYYEGIQQGGKHAKLTIRSKGV